MDRDASNVRRDDQPNDLPLKVIVYRSKAVSSLSPEAISDLVKAARTRNAREAVTGCLIYDEGRFLQWLEGPPSGLMRITDSISSDKRHEAIQIFRKSHVRRRAFRGWHMRLSGRSSSHLGVWPADAVEASPELLASLHSRPEDAPRIMHQWATSWPSGVQSVSPPRSQIDIAVDNYRRVSAQLDEKRSAFSKIEDAFFSDLTSDKLYFQALSEQDRLQSAVAAARVKLYEANLCTIHDALSLVLAMREIEEEVFEDRDFANVIDHLIDWLEGQAAHSH